MENLKNIIIVHHDGDNDGMMAGTIAYNMYAEEIKNEFVKLYGYNYQPEGEFMSEVETENPTNKLFQFIDITPSLDWLESIKDELEAGTIEIQIFDHHELKYKDILELKLPNIEYHYDSEYCGSYIYLRHWKEMLNDNLLNNDNVSMLFDAKIQQYVDMVDCYDTWKFVKLSHGKERVLAFNEFFDMRTSVEEFSDAILMYSLNDVIEEGKIIIEYKIKKEIPRQIKNTILSSNYSQNSHPLLLVPGSSSFYSQKIMNEWFSGHILGIIYYNIDLKTKQVFLSLRSNIPNTIDCAKLARTFNPSGGGHKEAAGCSIGLDDFMTTFQIGTVIDVVYFNTHPLPSYQEYKQIKSKLELLQECNCFD